MIGHPQEKKKRNFLLIYSLNKSTIDAKTEENCTFHPKILNNTKIMKTLKSKTKYDKSSQKYLERVHKARVIENERQQKLNPDYSN